MKLTSIEKIVSVEKHSNADSLDIVKVLNYNVITRRDQYKAGDLVIFIQPDTVLPELPWSAIYRAKSNRVKAIRLRGLWSMGIVEAFANVGYTGPIEEGLEISAEIGVTKYEPPQPQDLSAAGPYGFGIPRTDETRWQNFSDKELPFGEKVDVTLKYDGQSMSCLYKLPTETEAEFFAVGGRSFLFKMDVTNNYTANAKKHSIQEKMRVFCEKHKVNLCIRGESYGKGIQAFNHNPHNKLANDFAVFSVWLIDERRYARKGEPFYFLNIADEIGLPTVRVVEKDVVLTKELIQKYDEGIDNIDGNPFEGVVVQWAGGSFKIINKHYDAKK